MLAKDSILCGHIRIVLQCAHDQITACGKGHDDGNGDGTAVDSVDPEQVRLGKVALVGISNRKGNVTTHLVLEAVVAGMEMTTMDAIPSG